MYSNLTSLRTEFKRALDQLYDVREIDNIFFLVLEDLMGVNKLLFHSGARELTEKESAEMTGVLKQLQDGRPVQQILGSCVFDGLRFEVNEHVLIPRPETEELVNWIKSDQATNQPKSIWDIGTGSGCIAISLAKAFPNAMVIASDISEEGLSLASSNATSNQTSQRMIFKLHNVLQEIPPLTENISVIVSNPPYIPIAEKGSMDVHVTKYEPDLALFVPDDDPLIFYRRIMEIASSILLMGGNVYFELHEELAHPTVELFNPDHWKVTLKQDMQGKSRMLRAERIS